MKFSVGYQIFADDEFVESIIEHKDSISEVYFSFGDFPNGRNNQLKRSDMSPFDAEEKMKSDLEKISGAGIKLNLLFNATCYGKDSLSRSLFEKIGDTTDFVMEKYSLSGITTTSPVIASFIKKNFEGIDVRASVNMCIGTVEGMEYVKDSFDSFYLKRELNRDFTAIEKLKKWCDDNGKVLYALANSGCLNFCSAHTFHDNLVSHESEISAMDNGFVFEGVCKRFLGDRENLKKVCDYTGFIRPEDIHLYEGFFPSMKLATRVNGNPERVLKAYMDFKKHRGSVLELLEPNHTSLLYPEIIENSLIESKVENGKLVYSADKAFIKLQTGGDFQLC